MGLLLLLPLVRERLNGEGLQAIWAAHSSLCILNQAFRNHDGEWIFEINQAKRLKHIFEDLAEQGNLFRQKGPSAFQKCVDRHGRTHLSTRKFIPSAPTRC